nr:adenylate/guanylate cyclase domain-containing protein [Rathayibacter oskolensis]
MWPDGSADRRVVIVAVDDDSVAEVGEWPWSRQAQGELVDAVADAGAAVIGYDVLLPGDAGDDDSLARALSRVPTVVAEGYSSAVRTDRGLLSVSGAVAPGPEISSAARAVGHAVITADTDGVTRTVPLVVAPAGEDFAGSLALRVADLADGAVDQLYVRPGMVQVGGLSVPTEGDAAVRVHWSAGLEPRGPSIVSAADLLDGSIDPAVLDGAVVFVGATAVALGDRHVTPLRPGATTPGVVVQAQVASTILSSGWVLPVAPWWSALLVLVLSSGLARAALTLRLRWVAVAAVGVPALYLVAAVVVFGTLGLLADTVRVPVALVGSTVLAVVVRLLVEQRERRRTIDLFTRYVPESVAEHLLRTGRAREAADGERVRVGLVFCDLRGFTPLAASLRPGQVREILDRYYDFACAVVFEHRGTVMQFVGDEVFAVFGAPDPLDDPASAARACGLALQARAGELERELAAAGLPEVRFGVGVHVGEVVAAHVGPVRRRQYAVIGDPVNVGSRLCGTARAGEVVLSVAVAEGAVGGDVEAVELKGVADPVAMIRVAAPVGWSGGPTATSPAPADGDGTRGEPAAAHPNQT